MGTPKIPKCNVCGTQCDRQCFADLLLNDAVQTRYQLVSNFWCRKLTWADWDNAGEQ